MFKNISFKFFLKEGNNSLASQPFRNFYFLYFLYFAT